MLEETFSLSNLATGLVINIDTFFAVAFMPIVTAYSDIVRRELEDDCFFSDSHAINGFLLCSKCVDTDGTGHSTCSLLVFILMLILTNVFLGVLRDIYGSNV